MWLCVEKGIYLGLGNTVGKRKPEKYSTAKDYKVRILSLVMNWQLVRQWKRSIPVMMVISYSGIQNRGWGVSVILLEVNSLKMKMVW